jgi:hypothetical protein
MGDLKISILDILPIIFSPNEKWLIIKSEDNFGKSYANYLTELLFI